jgi:hypothetical protein
VRLPAHDCGTVGHNEFNRKGTPAVHTPRVENTGVALRLRHGLEQLHVWINLQAQYDLWTVRHQARPKVKRLAA